MGRQKNVRRQIALTNMLSVSLPTVTSVQEGRVRTLCADKRTFLGALLYKVRAKSPPLSWLSPRNIWASVPNYRGPNRFRRFLANIVKLAYLIEVRYNKIF